MTRHADGKRHLKTECLAHTPLSYEAVERWYKDDGWDATEREKIIRLCLSHERLRAERDGTEIMLREAQAALKQINTLLTIPAAEYVPAISDVFTVIDKTLGKNWRDSE